MGTIMTALSENQYFTTLKAESRSDKAKLATALSVKLTSLKSIRGEKISVGELLIKGMEYDDPESKGEKKEGWRIVLFCTNGEMYSASGNAVITALDNAFDIFGGISMEEPIEFEVQLQQSGQNSDREYVSLIAIG